MSQGIIVCRKQTFGSLGLHNILPRSSSGGWEPQVKVFDGRMCVCELMSKIDDLPWYRIVFEWTNDDAGDKQRFFSHTMIMKGTRDLNKTVQTCGEYFEVLMECSNEKWVALELRIADMREDQKFRDLLFRIREEYEMIDELMGSSDSSDFGDFVG
ncbi:LANO_0H24124g1_1 [Lachancea nothofagi CBS 11611]|uniref:LANO_0H24124g1_1 n=1 Tax=Lachancea nothofagi CBS 11611 TaxID=1266666 RepID=A0A1G4KP02_9SACH|nr:LANO_0H24124g1_1 [Lachancea nothofagi CBS 11611]